MSVLVTFYIEDGGKSESHTLALSSRYELLNCIFIIILIIISPVEQAAQLIFLSFSGIGTPFLLGHPFSTPWSWWGCNHGVSLPSQLTDTLQEGWSLTIVHFSLVPGIGPRGGGFIRSIRIVSQNFGRGVRRVVPSIFLKVKS